MKRQKTLTRLEILPESYKMVARGTSMEPFIRNGDVVEFRPVDADARLVRGRFYHVEAEEGMVRGSRVHRPIFLSQLDHASKNLLGFVRPKTKAIEIVQRKDVLRIGEVVRLWFHGAATASANVDCK